MTDAPGRFAPVIPLAGSRRGRGQLPQTRQIPAPRDFAVLAPVFPFAPLPGGRAGGRVAGPFVELAFGLLTGGRTARPLRRDACAGPRTDPQPGLAARVTTPTGLRRADTR
jgi:hypothetical protein